MNPITHEEAIKAAKEMFLSYEPPYWQIRKQISEGAYRHVFVSWERTRDQVLAEIRNRIKLSSD